MSKLLQIDFRNGPIFSILNVYHLLTGGSVYAGKM